MGRDKAIFVLRLNIYLTLGLLCLLVLSSIDCSRGDRVKPGRSSVTVLFQGNEYSMNPFGGNTTDHLVFIPLFTTDKNGEMKPKLAERWEHSPDYRTWTIHLRRDVRWHDGMPVTAHDVKFSMELWAHPDVEMSVPGDAITVLDNFTLKVVHKKPSRDIINDWKVFYPKHLLENLDPKEIERWEFWTHPVGNGPYRYVRHVPKTMMEFEANPDYFLGKPRIEKVVIKFGGASGLTELLSGNVDVIALGNRIDILKLKDDPRFAVYDWVNPNVYIAILWNHRHPLFSDPIIRRALTLAINRRELHKVLNLPEILRIFDVPFSMRQFRRGEIREPLPFNPKLASQLLEEAGWRDIDSDGIREREGKEFRFSMLVSDRAFSGETPAVYIQEQLRRVGVRMEITTLNFMPLHVRYRAGDFDAAIHIFNNFPGVTMSYSSIGYDNPRIFQLHKSAEITLDPDKLDKIYRELQAIHSQDLPLTFLYNGVESFVALKCIRRLSTPFWAYPVIYMEHLWIEED